MTLTDEDVRAFIDVYEAEHGVRLSFEDAWEMASRLMQLYELLSRQPPDVEDLDYGEP